MPFRRMKHHHRITATLVEQAVTLLALLERRLDLLAGDAVAKLQAAIGNVVLVVKPSRLLVPGDVGQGVRLQVGLPLGIVQHLADEGEFTFGVGQQNGKNVIESLASVRMRNELVLHLAQLGQHLVLAQNLAALPFLVLFALGQVASHSDVASAVGSNDAAWNR